MDLATLPRRIAESIPPTDPAGLAQFNTRHASHHIHEADKLFRRAARLAYLAARFDAPPPRQYYEARCAAWEQLLEARALMRVATPLVALLDFQDLKDDRGIVGQARRTYLRRRVELLNGMLDERFAAGDGALQEAQCTES